MKIQEAARHASAGEVHDGMTRRGNFCCIRTDSVDGWTTAHILGPGHVCRMQSAECREGVVDHVAARYVVP